MKLHEDRNAEAGESEAINFTTKEEMLEIELVKPGKFVKLTKTFKR